MAPPQEAPIDGKTIATPATARRLPPIQYVNQHQIMLEYELHRVGPSGIGGIEVWLTKDDGQAWEPYARDEDVQSGSTCVVSNGSSICATPPTARSPTASTACRWS